MYRFSRAIYRELASEIVASTPEQARESHARVLRACEAAVERLALDRDYFAKPARTLFCDIRAYFPVGAQARVCLVVSQYLKLADEHLARQALDGRNLNGEPLRCRATTRRGTPCQRDPLARNGYCPSHQHLAEGPAAAPRPGEAREPLAA